MKKGREVPQYLPSVAGVSTFGVMKAHDAPPQARLLRRRRARSLGRSRWITNLVNPVAGAGAKASRHIACVHAMFVTFRNICWIPLLVSSWHAARPRSPKELTVSRMVCPNGVFYLEQIKILNLRDKYLQPIKFAGK